MQSFSSIDGARTRGCVATARLPEKRTLSLLLLVACGLAGCSLFGSKEPPAQPLVLGKWQEGSLHCSARQCKRLYQFRVDQPAELSIVADAPADPRLPDFSMALLDSNMATIVMDSAPLERPRRITRRLETGVYHVSISGLGKLKDPLAYKLKATRVSKKRPVKKVRKPKPPPPPAPTLVRAEIIEVERSGGEPIAVLIAIGTSDGVTPGQEAELVEGDAVIGRLKVVDVYAAGSRAQIVGGLSAPITLDTEVQLRK